MVPLKRIVENTDTRAGRLFDGVVQLLIVASIVAFSVATLPQLDPQVRRALRVFQVVSIIAFTIEYVLRLIVADRPWRFVSSFGGLIDLAAILPFYLASGVDLRAVRAFRLFKLARLFHMWGFSRAMARYGRAFVSIRAELGVHLLASIVMMFLASVGIYYFESQVQPEVFGTLFDCLWWALVTLTTVGYGDAFPVTTGGRLFTGLIILIGIGTVAMPSGLMASALERTRRDPGGDDDEPSCARCSLGCSTAQRGGTRDAREMTRIAGGRCADGTSAPT